jgi:AraC-like DNA-binding protein
VTDSSTWDEIFLVFSGPVFELAEKAGLLQRSTPVIHAGTDRSWARRLDSFRTRPAPQSQMERDAETVEILHLVTDLVRSPQDPSAVDAADWRQLSRRLLSENLQDRLELADVAAACGMSYESWRRKFREDTGETPARYRLAARLDAAEAMLRLTSASVREIAGSVGLTDEQHLNRHFLASRGVTARQYRTALAG